MLSKPLALASSLFRRCCFALSLLALLVLSSCAARHDGAADPSSAPPAVVNGTVVPTPQGVDAALWRQLCSELDRVLAQEGTARRTAGVPIGKGSSVPDLHTYASGINSVYEWSYRQHGDFDLNGTVNISDLTQIGIHFGKNTFSADWQKAQLADGDVNGVINVADVTAIGLNWNGRVDGYELQWRQTAADPWVKLASSAFIAGDPSTGLYPQHQKFTAFNAPGPDYRVVPYFDDGTQRQYGASSNVIGSLTIPGRCWNTGRANTARDGCVLLYGPDNPDVIWTYDLPNTSFLTFFNEPVSDCTGTIYIGTTAGSSFTDTQPGLFYALTLDGALRWKLQTNRGICGYPACSSSARVIVGDLGGLVYCFAPDGKQIWRRQITGVIALTAPLIGSDDMVYILCHATTGGAISTSTLYKLDNAGAIVWSRDLNSKCINSPFFDTEGNISVVDSTGKVSSYKPDSTLWYQFATGSVPFDSTDARGVVERGGFLYFATDDKGIRGIAYNNTISTLFGLDDELPITMPSINILGDCAIGTSDTTPFETSKLNYISGNAEVWEVTLPGNYLSDIALDLNSRMYLTSCLLEQGDPGTDNGVHCIWQDQTKAWFYPTGTYYPMNLALVADKQLAVMALGTDGMRLISIKGN
jgi:hypothetical protein